LKVLYTNADQFLNKRDDLLMLITGNKPDLILINEVLPKAHSTCISSCRVDIPDYFRFSNFDPDHIEQTAGLRGICIYVFNKLVPTEVSFSHSQLIESLWIKIILNGSNNILIGCVYRSPSSSLENSTNSLCQLLKQAVKSTSSYLICGDFNYNNIDWENICLTSNNSTVQSFLDTVQDLFMFQHILKPTRYRGEETPNLLDLVFTDDENMIENLTYLPGLGNSDHLCISYDLITPSSQVIESDDVPKYNVYHADFENMKLLLSAVEWETEMTDLSVNDCWDYFSTTFNEIMRTCIPLAKPKHRKNIYMTKEAMIMKNKKNRLWRNYTVSKSPEDLVAFKHARDSLRSLTRQLRSDFEKNLAGNIKTNSKCFWKYVNSRIQSRFPIKDLTTSDGCVIESDKDKANAFNKFFSSVFTIEDGSSLPDFSINVDAPILNDVPITPEIVYTKLSNLNPNKAAGPDNWPPKVLKEMAEQLCIPLTILFRKSLNTSTLPTSWKRGHVIPIHKKGSRRLVDNYRPITLTSIVGKLLESIVKDHILDSFIRNNLLSSYQHGFMPGKSCVTQLLYVMELWTESLDQGNPIDVIYFDFRKAFDSVPHARLLLKLQTYGIRGNLLKWIRHFLMDRKQRVIVHNEQSEWCDVISGVPQGSVLGPLLFAIYVNDLPEVVQSLLFLFADDTKLFRSIVSDLDVAQLQADVDNFLIWTKNWLLNINNSKCKCMRIGISSVSSHNYLINGESLCTTIAEKDLGVIIDQNLKFHQHAAAAAAKANRILGLISKCFEHLDVDTLPLLYKTLVRPSLEYANAIWGPHYITDQKLLERVQRRATKLVPSLKDLPYAERLSHLQLPSLCYRRKRGDMILVYQMLNGLLNIDSSFFFSSTVYHSTRGHKFKLSKQHFHKNIRSHALSIRVINDWNSLPDYIVNASSLTLFKQLLDEHWTDYHYLFND